MKKESRWDRFCDWLENLITTPDIEKDPWNMTKERREEVSRIGLAPPYIAGKSRMEFKHK